MAAKPYHMKSRARPVRQTPLGRDRIRVDRHRGLVAHHQGHHWKACVGIFLFAIQGNGSEMRWRPQKNNGEQNPCAAIPVIAAEAIKVPSRQLRTNHDVLRRTRLTKWYRFPRRR